MHPLRRELGPQDRKAVDWHWKHSVGDAVQLINTQEALDPWFAEASTIPENVAGLAKIAEQTIVPVAAGEKWRMAPLRSTCVAV